MANLQELDSLEMLVIVDNELDPISPCPHPAVQQSGNLKDIAMRGPKFQDNERGEALGEFRMDNICCGAHGLSVMITGIKGEEQHTVLFDTGPEAHAWERNAQRLQADIGKIEAIQLSHWHIDHSGGMLKALDLIHEAKAVDPSGSTAKSVEVDLHPNRPAYRGFQPPGAPPMSMQPDPTFEAIEQHGGTVRKHDAAHTIAQEFFLVSGEIPRVTPYEQGLKFGVRFVPEAGKWESDEKMADERFLMCKVKGKGLVMFTGCSHAGVVNASKHALELGNGTPLYGVMGGFHLADAEPAQIKDTATDLKALGTQVLFTGHCTGWRAKFEIQNQMPGRLVPSFVGTKYVV